MMVWKSILLVGAGGGLGSIFRFLTHRWVCRLYPHVFPLGTMLVNISGCFLIGILFGLMEKGSLLKEEWRVLLITGFCGGYTTFSTFAAENIQLLKDGRLLYFMIYTAGSILIGILATFAGMAVLK